ncbi:hypothetical protein, partial [Streptomyces sp. S1]|uniref:hypothetical protein n=1 Tax=Streptomyces sp. S1 TaxID=718288 RepID=UPI003D71135C
MDAQKVVHGPAIACLVVLGKEASLNQLPQQQGDLVGRLVSEGCDSGSGDVRAGVETEEAIEVGLLVGEAGKALVEDGAQVALAVIKAAEAAAGVG